MNRYENPFGGQNPDIQRTKESIGRHRNLIRLIIAGAVAVIVGGASYYKVYEGEVGIVTRFGKYHEKADAGLHFKVPFVDSVRMYPEPKANLKVEFGFRTQKSGVKSSFLRNEYTRDEATMLTGDLNVSVVEWVVQYNIIDPVQYAFRVRNVENTLRALSEATMRSVVGDYSVTEVLTSGRDEIIQKAIVQLSKLCDLYDTGISISALEIRDATVPEPVQPSFNEVNQAEQERDRMLNDAWAQYNKEIPKAQGEANQMIQQAEGYAVERVNRSRGEVERFKDIQKEYQAAPEVTRTRIYLETLNDVLPKAGKKLFVDDEAKNVIPMLMPMPGAGAATVGGLK